jgi:tetratricopeptide (TPR) repeat protein
VHAAALPVGGITFMNMSGVLAPSGAGHARIGISPPSPPIGGVMKFHRLPACFFLLALGVLPGLAQNSPGVPNAPNRHAMFSIGGTVRDDTDHHTIDSVLVTLKLITGPTVNTAYTHSNGEFQFDGLRSGDYVLEIALRDYDTYRDSFTVSDGSRMGMSIFLARTGKSAAARPAPAPQMSISAHQLSVPHKAHDEFEKGMSLIYLKSDYRGAINQFQLAIRDFPTYYEAYSEEGSAYYQLKQLEPAEESLRKAIELSSGTYADAMFTLAALLTDTKRYDEAEAIARRGISADASSWRGPFELARALTALKKSDDAEKYGQQSRDLMPDNPPVYLLLANIHIQRKDYPSLVRDLDDYLRLSPSGPEAEQARKTKERVKGLMNAPKQDAANGDSAKAGDDADPDVDDADPDAPPEKHSGPAVAPDNSGLPSLPAPTPTN